MSASQNQCVPQCNINNHAAKKPLLTRCKVSPALWKPFWAVTALWWKITSKQLWRKLVVSVQNRFNTSQFNMNFISSQTARQFWSVKFKYGASIYRCYEPTTRKCSHLDWINLYQNDLYPNVFVLKWLEITVNQWPSFFSFVFKLSNHSAKSVPCE